MNKSQVIILWVIAIALGVAVTTIKLTRKDSNSSTTHRAAGQTLFESFPGTEVSAVNLQGATGSVDLVKKDGKWTVAQRDSYPANMTFVNDFLRTLGDLKVTRGLEAGPSLAPRFGMDEAATKADERGLTATFKNGAGKELAKVTLGKRIESGADNSPMGGATAVGRYIRNHADESGFYAVNEMFPSVSTEPVRWLSEDFISPEKIKSITLSQNGKDEPAWKISRDTEEAEFKLDKAEANEVLDTSATAQFKSLFSYARFEDVIPADKVAERTADLAAKRTAVIETFEGFVYTLTITPAKAPAPPAVTDPKNPPTPPSADSQLITVTVTAELPKERKKAADEKPEDAKVKDDAFAERAKNLAEKLTKEKALAGRTFELSKTTMDALLKEREKIVTKVTPPAPSADNNAVGPVQQLPGGMIVPPQSGNNAAPQPAATPSPAPVAKPSPQPNTKGVPQPGAKPAPHPAPKAKTPPVEAVTPPISASPAEEKKDAGK